MKKTIIKAVIALAICVMMILPVGISAFAELGSHGFYVDADTSSTSKKFDGFLIDFRSDCDNALSTYFELAGLGMSTKESVKKLGYFGISGGGGYAGLQVRYSAGERVGIMSLWKYEYTDIKTKEKVDLFADLVYPYEQQGSFDNEGSGVNWIHEYKWDDHKWYRQLLFCWNDAELDRTFAGTWFYDYEADEWFLHAYFNTKLYNSYFENGFGQFIENWYVRYNRMVRAASYKGFYVLDHETGEWTSLPRLRLTTDNNLQCVGTTTLGISDDKTFVWEHVDGTIDDPNFKKLDQTFKITQDEKPSYGKLDVVDLTLDETDGNATLKWELGKHTTPQLSSKIEAIDANGNVISTSYKTRPEIREQTIEGVSSKAAKYVVTLTDVFGQSETKEIVSTSASETTKAPETKGNETVVAPETTKAPATAPATSTGTSENTTTSSNTIVIVIAVVVAVIVIGCAAFFILKKKKV